MSGCFSRDINYSCTRDPETNIAPENGWLEYYYPIFRCVWLLVSRSVTCGDSCGLHLPLPQFDFGSEWWHREYFGPTNWISGIHGIHYRRLTWQWNIHQEKRCIMMYLFSTTGIFSPRQFSGVYTYKNWGFEKTNWRHMKSCATVKPKPKTSTLRYTKK